MPEAKDLEAAVDRGAVRAITLDTNFIIEASFHFGGGKLLSVAQFKDTPFQVLITEVTQRETVNKLAAHQRTTSDGLLKSIKKYKDAWEVEVDFPGLGTHEEALASARARWDAYLQATGATILGWDHGVDLSILMEMYFRQKAPFGPNKQKEFPDAVAVLILQAWSKANKGMVVAISKDGDWIAFADRSDFLFCLPDLDTALDIFNRDERFSAQRITALIKTREGTHLVEAIDRALEDLNDDSIDVEAGGDLPMEPDLHTIEVTHWEVEDGPLVRQADQTSITIALWLRCDLTATANFQFYVKDSVDGDYVDMFCPTASREVEERVMISITCPRELSAEMEALAVEIDERPRSIEFGYIDMHADEDFDL